MSTPTEKVEAQRKAWAQSYSKHLVGPDELALLLAAQQGEAWQPIETVPLRQTVLAWSDNNGLLCMMMPNERQYVSQHLSHWMPLPAAPVNKESNREAD